MGQVVLSAPSPFDLDGDGVSNEQEAIDGTDPANSCDFVTANQTLTPSSAWTAADCDGDGVTNATEVTDGTDPLDPCSYTVASITLTVSSTGDCDGDGVTNATEAADGTDPQDPCSFVLANATVAPNAAWNAADCDGDGVTNATEVTDGTNPLDGCSFVLANATLAPDAAWNAADCDGDGVTNETEVTDGTNPSDDCSFTTANITLTVTSTGDCDGDGVTNATEATDGTDPQDPCSRIIASITLPVSITDTDGDNIADICDLDDDNDGILDTDEMYTGNLDFSSAIGGNGLGNIITDEPITDNCSGTTFSLVSIVADDGQNLTGNANSTLRSRFVPTAPGFGDINEFELQFSDPVSMRVSYPNAGNAVAPSGQFFTFEEGYTFEVPAGKYNNIKRSR